MNEQIKQLIEAGELENSKTVPDPLGTGKHVPFKFNYEYYGRQTCNTREAVKAMAAENELMREALEVIACLGNHGRHGNSDRNMIAIQALKGKDDE